MSDYIEMPIPIDISRTGLREALFRSYRDEEAAFDVLLIQVSNLNDLEYALNAISELEETLPPFRNASVEIDSNLKRDAWRLHRYSNTKDGRTINRVVVGSDGACS
jgi:hypothetical protein